MLRLLLALALSGCGAATSPSTSPVTTMPADAPSSLFEFADGEPRWQVVNDGVMGGLSKGFVAVEDGTLRFTGELVTRGGGFTSVRAPKSIDLTGADGVEMRVRGGGRTFEIDLDDGTRMGGAFRGRQVSRRATFATTEDWQTVRVPFSALESSVFGQPMDAAPFDPAALQSVGLFIADGIDGPFRLEVDWIRAAR